MLYSSGGNKLNFIKNPSNAIFNLYHVKQIKCPCYCIVATGLSSWGLVSSTEFTFLVCSVLVWSSDCVVHTYISFTSTSTSTLCFFCPPLSLLFVCFAYRAVTHSPVHYTINWHRRWTPRQFMRRESDLNIDFTFTAHLTLLPIRLTLVRHWCSPCTIFFLRISIRLKLIGF